MNVGNYTNKSNRDGPGGDKPNVECPTDSKSNFHGVGVHAKVRPNHISGCRFEIFARCIQLVEEDVEMKQKD
jgi:hypothetical protein